MSLLSGSILLTLTRTTVPMVLGLLSLFLFQLIDAYFISKLGTTPLAAISFTFPITFGAISICLGISIGTTSVLSRTLGQKNHLLAQSITTHSIYLITIIAITMGLSGYASITPLFKLMGAPPILLPHINHYMSIWFLGIILVAVPLVSNSAIRATGNTLIPSIIMIATSLLNLILDPLLMFGYFGLPKLGIQGAAIATVISWVFTCISGLLALHFKTNLIVFTRPSLQTLWQSWKPVLYIGIPATGTTLLAPLSTAIITKVIAPHGEAAVAGYGLGSRIESIAIIVLLALTTTLSPFIGQNWGASQFNRIKQALRSTLLFSLLWQSGVYCLLLLLIHPIGTTFSSNPDVLHSFKLFIIWVSLSYGFHGIELICTTAFNAINQPLLSTIISLNRLFILLLPCTYIGNLLYGIHGVYIGVAIANIISGTIAFILLKNKRHLLK